MQFISTDLERLSDEELAQLARSGNESAANLLVERMYSLVYYAAKAFDHAGMETADIMQEGMIGLIQAIRTFNVQNNTKFKTYAKSCIQHHLSSTIRRIKQKKQIPQNKLISINKFSVQKTVAGPEDLIIEREFFANSIDTLRRNLSAFEFEIFKKYLSGYSTAEIADSLGISVKRVSNALYRIKQKIHSLFK